MPLTMQELRYWLDAEEVDYQQASKLGAAAAPLLLELVQGANLNLACKAVYLGSLLRGKGATAVLEAAAISKEPVVRVAAAAGIRNLRPAAAELLLDVLAHDPDAGIRKVALQSANRLRSPQLVAKAHALAAHDPEPFIRELAENNS
jgi:HEAT repeat protein